MALKIYTTSAADLRGTATAVAVATRRSARQPRPGWVRQYDANVQMKGTFTTRTKTIVNY